MLAAIRRASSRVAASLPIGVPPDDRAATYADASAIRHPGRSQHPAISAASTATTGTDYRSPRRVSFP
jgi:hypothetical protein